MRSKKTEGISPKKTTETKKVVETKKTYEPYVEKIPEKSNSNAPVKKNLTILKRPSQPEVSPINPPSNSE
jgi:hypothetical protein